MDGSIPPATGSGCHGGRETLRDAARAAKNGWNSRLFSGTVTCINAVRLTGTTTPSAIGSDRTYFKPANNTTLQNRSAQIVGIELFNTP